MYTKFWDSHQSPGSLLEVNLRFCAYTDVHTVLLGLQLISPCLACTQELKGGATPDGVVKVVKLLKSRPLDWPSCLRLGRIKFEKYFNHRVSHCQ